VADQAAVDRRPRRRSVHLPAQPAEDRAWTPAGVGSSELHDPRFELRSDLVRAPVGPGAAVGQGAEALAGVADQPAVDGPSIDAVAGGHVGDLGAVEHLPDREVALLNHRKLREHPEIPLGSVGRQVKIRTELEVERVGHGCRSHRRPGAGATSVKVV
jgi:hypothetical protein